jgi:arylsulfatase B
MKKWIWLFVFIFLATQGNSQQNTILFIADDVSPDYFSAFSSNTDTAITPNINRLAEAGVKFTKVWASPVCSPTRAGILTGRYSFRTGVGEVIANALSPQLDTAEISIAQLLRKDSPIKYSTACVGKWHLHAATPNQLLFPNVMGFNFYSGNFNGALNNYYSYPIITNGIADSAFTYATTQTVNDAVGWLDTIQTGNPFFLWVAFNSPHSPYHIPPANLCNTAGLLGTPQHLNTNPELYFKAAIQAMDTEIGRLLDYLDANGLRDSTNIIFIGDNGNATQVAQTTNQFHSKGTCYDYGVRVPMIICGPAIVDSNRTSFELVSTVDLFATIAELCNFSNWNNFIPQSTLVDSKSFVPILKNQGSNNRTWIFSEQFNLPPIPEDGKTIRNADFHLIRKEDGTEEFYNQTLDPEENVNLLLGIMNATEINNYNFLCDTISALSGIAGCHILGEEEYSTDHEINYFPNPTNSFVVLQTESEIESVKFHDLTGKLVGTYFSNKINVADFPVGVYAVTVILKNGKIYHGRVNVIK